MIELTSAGKAYLLAKSNLEKAKCFHFVRYFEYRGNKDKGKLEGAAIISHSAHFLVEDSARQEGEWITFFDPWAGFINYHRKEKSWQPEENTIIGNVVQSVINLEIFGDEHRAVRDINLAGSEIVEGQKCKYYEWSVESGGYYKIWINLRTHNVVKLYQALPRITSTTIFSKIGVPVIIEKPC